MTFDPADFSGNVPVFPLPNVVFFPGNAMPLHIFEPRYRELTRAALEGERLIALALQHSGPTEAAAEEPGFHEVVGMGKIIEDTRLEDGRYNLLLFGVARVRIREIISQTPYRTARVDILRDRIGESKTLERRRKLLLAFYEQLVREYSKGQMTAPPQDLPLGLICDLLVSLINFDPETKQSMLEETDVAVRSERLLGMLKSMNAPGLDETSDRPRKWPPAQSVN